MTEDNVTESQIVEMMSQAAVDHLLGGEDDWGLTEDDKKYYPPVMRAILQRLEDNGLAVFPIEPTDTMWITGRQPILARDTTGGQWSLKQHLNRAFEFIPAWVSNLELNRLGKVTKGDCAVMVYRAMTQQFQEDKNLE